MSDGPDVVGAVALASLSYGAFALVWTSVAWFGFSKDAAFFAGIPIAALAIAIGIGAAALAGDSE